MSRYKIRYAKQIDTISEIHARYLSIQNKTPRVAASLVDNQRKGEERMYGRLYFSRI